MAKADKTDKTDRVRVEKVEIKIGRKVISLTPDELKELRDVLDEAFPRDKTTFVPGSPIYIDRYVPSWSSWRPTKYWDYTWLQGGMRCGPAGTNVQPDWQTMGSSGWQGISGSGTLRLECKSSAGCSG